ncbi:MAG: ATP-binding cassette domain-containing protein [Ilumatobacteraceae bacterium]|nr:ATP-binding cassette domain-containing protein [Ilumatobacteraceae bacterium]
MSDHHPTLSSEPAAEARNLTKRYGSTAVVDDVTFRVHPGTITGVLGPNGAGKTTTLRILLGLATPTSGEVRIDGHPPHELDDPSRHVGAVLEANDFHPARSGRDHLRVLARLCDVGDGRVDELLDTVGLRAAADRQVGRYSLGMRQRLGLATALLGAPGLLVLDEPTNGLDPVGVRWMRDLMRGFADGGGAVLMSSHLLAEAQHTVDHVLIIDQGRLIADAPLADLVHPGYDLEAVYLDLVTTTAGADR